DNWVASNLDVYGQDVKTSFDAASGLLSKGMPSGFEVEIVDPDLLIIAISRDELKFQGHADVLPSPVDVPATFDNADPALNEATLQSLAKDKDFTLATVMTVSPASPNDLRRLYEIKAPVSDLWEKYKMDSQDCDGPDQEVRSHIAEARVAWQEGDNTPAAIVLSIGGSTGSITDSDPTTTLTPINLVQELQPLAQAIAIADLIPKLDHYEGRKAVPMNAKYVPIGSITKVTHRVTKNRAVSVLEGTGPSTSYDATDFLRGSARSYLLKQIQAQR